MGEWKAQISLRVRQDLPREMEEFADKERLKRGNVGEVVLEWAWTQLQAAGSVHRLLKFAPVLGLAHSDGCGGATCCAILGNAVPTRAAVPRFWRHRCVTANTTSFSRHRSESFSDLSPTPSPPAPLAYKQSSR
jgi:hypothetical protein